MHPNLQDSIADAMDLILTNANHPSLRTGSVSKAKKAGVKPPVMYSRVNKGIRITWQELYQPQEENIKGYYYIFFRNVGEHDPTLDNF